MLWVSSGVVSRVWVHVEIVHCADNLLWYYASPCYTIQVMQQFQVSSNSDCLWLLNGFRSFRVVCTYMAWPWLSLPCPIHALPTNSSLEPPKKQVKFPEATGSFPEDSRKLTKHLWPRADLAHFSFPNSFVPNAFHTIVVLHLLVSGLLAECAASWKGRLLYHFIHVRWGGVRAGSKESTYNATYTSQVLLTCKRRAT